MIKTNEYLVELFRENFIKPNVKIKVTRLNGITRLSILFRKEKCDTAYIRFFIHPFFEILMCDIFLFKNGKILRDENDRIKASTNVQVTLELMRDLRFIEDSDVQII